jgi:hypothetical protein
MQHFSELPRRGSSSVFMHPPSMGIHGVSGVCSVAIVVGVTCGIVAGMVYIVWHPFGGPNFDLVRGGPHLTLI